jgi:hypothetical protein
MEILLSPVAGLLMLFISRCSIKTGCYCRFGETVKLFFWEPGKVFDQRMMDASNAGYKQKCWIKAFTGTAVLSNQ